MCSLLPFPVSLPSKATSIQSQFFVFPFCLHHVEIYHSIIDPAYQFFFSASNDRLPTSHLIVLWFIRQKRVKSLTGAVGKECRWRGDDASPPPHTHTQHASSNWKGRRSVILLAFNKLPSDNHYNNSPNILFITTSFRDRSSHNPNKTKYGVLYTNKTKPTRLNARYLRV